MSYESAAELPACLATIRRSPEVTVIVVDNASSDDSVAVAHRAGADLVLANPVNTGFAHAVNRGLAHTSADHVLLLNPDALVQPDCLARLVDDLRRVPHAGVVAPVLRAADGGLTAGAGRTATLARRVLLCLPGVGRLSALRPEYTLPAEEAVRSHVVDVGYVYGAALLTRRELIVDLHGLDERFFLFAEDEDFCRRVRHAGRRVLLDGGAVADHVGGASCADGAATEAQRLYSTWRLIHKWDGAAAAAAYRAGIRAAFRARACVAHACAQTRASVYAGVRREDQPPRLTRPREIARTLQLFEMAVREGRDPLKPQPLTGDAGTLNTAPSASLPQTSSTNP